jgi:hypothetical protein
MESALIDICLGCKPEIILNCNGTSGIKYYDFGEGVFDGKLYKKNHHINYAVKEMIYTREGELLKPVTNSLSRHGYLIYFKVNLK